MATTEDPVEPLLNVIALSLACILELFVIVTGEDICRPPFAFIVPLFVIVAVVDVLLKLIEFPSPVEIVPLFIILFTNTFETLTPTKDAQVLRWVSLETLESEHLTWPVDQVVAKMLIGE